MMSEFIGRRTSPEPVSRALSLAVTLSLAVSCWVGVVAGARWLFG